jgi:hypothetical protein
MRLTAVARSSAVFNVSEMMRVKDRIIPSSLRCASGGRPRGSRAPAGVFDRGLDLAVDLGQMRVASVSDWLCASKRFTTC